MVEITNGKIIERLIRTEKNICSLRKQWDDTDQNSWNETDDWYNKEINRLENRKWLLYDILMNDCRIDYKIIDAIIEGVDKLYDK